MIRDVIFALLAFWIFSKIRNSIHVFTGSSDAGRPDKKQEPPKKPGSVSVEYTPPLKKGRHDIEDSEYVDYEDVK